MKQYLILSLLFIFAIKINAQNQEEAIILENNTFIYKKPNQSSCRIYTLDKYDILLINESDEINSDYLFVEILKNKLSKISKKVPNFNKHEDFYTYGFIQKQKVTLLDSLQKYQANDIGLEFEVVKADTTLIINEDNMRYGLEIPLSMSFTVCEMSLIWKGKKIIQDKSIFDDLFNISFTPGIYTSIESNKNFENYFLDDYHYIKQQCGDGAGYYEITWKIKDGKIISRHIDTI